MTPINQAHTEFVHTAAHVYNLDAALICAVIEQESNWDTWACRYEPAFFRRYIQPMLDDERVRTITEAVMRATSYGLMQVMGQTAREQGFKGRWLTALCDPQVGIDYGCKVLRGKIDRTGSLQAGLLAYNGGGVPEYVEEVMARIPKYQDTEDKEA